ncbi:MarR family winged helix-turn-helix transcriptional regulator [Pseudonocardia sp. MH-G8]|uniref:MarR family winged helix-turn-helix transcriptional regulator n=1 Tax=Pseudonocardia sp. MH-G8 TaxID=1854588 RepID=UPI000BA02BA6|nr:MarR family transcriptional regulator [Pseudonocardia sp. MH-G8]OZM83090.1 MarR family transcriptional regulator [Pseudonocardia sp. MH-G8]
MTDQREDADGPADQRARVLDCLKIYGADYADLRRAFANWLQLHSADATALIEIANDEKRGQLLTPARLGERIRLSPNATSALLNRLEAADHVRRTHEHPDRRVTTLRAGARTHALVAEYFEPVAVQLDAAMADYPDDLLARFADFLQHLHHSMGAVLAEKHAEARGEHH